MERNEARRRVLDEAKRQADIALLSATGKDYLDAAERIKLAVALLRVVIGECSWSSHLHCLA